MEMPEDTKPKSFKSQEERLVYFTLPMSLNYQRNSYKLWESVLRTYRDKELQDLFDIQKCAKLSEHDLREKLMLYKIALQPNKHIYSWFTITQTIFSEWGSIT